MGGDERTWLVGDIGGTHVRFALTKPAGRRPTLSAVRILASTDFLDLQHAVQHYLADVQAQPRRAAFAVAAPVQSEHISLTNCSWSFHRAELAATLGLEELMILNDFGAAARGVSALESDDFELLQGCPDQALDGPISVIGPGTGMGVALLLRHPPDRWQVVETEGGHISFAPSCNEERRIYDWLAQQHGRVSIERVLSGRGLAAIHATLSAIGSNPSGDAPRAPAEIVGAALIESDPIAQAALARFCAILGSFAGDAALFHGARTVAICGGMVPRFLSFFKSSPFLDRFHAKGRFAAYLRSVNIVVVTHPVPGLLGAALSLGEAGCRTGSDLSQGHP